MRIFFSFMLLVLFTAASAQQYIKNQVPVAKTYLPEEVIDPEYGIKIYERLNFRLGGDSVRHCGRPSCSGWVQDRYDNGQLLHKGYYVEGQLKIYKNYYPNGKIERDFRTIDDYKSMMKIYYDDDTLKSQVKYVGRDPLKWEDFYANGQLEYYEEFNKNLDYQLSQKSFYPDGKPQSVFELINKKKLIFSKKEYNEAGIMTLKGEVYYNPDLFSYQKIGKWSVYDDNGKLTREEFYENGKLNDSKDY